MKRLFLICVLILSFSSTVLAVDYTVKITADEEKVLESWLGFGGVQVWLDNAIKGKINKRLDATIEEVTDKNPSKLTHSEKLDIIKTTVLPTRRGRDGF